MPAAAFLIPAALYPILVLLHMSFSRVDVSNVISGSWQWSGFANYRTVLNESDFSAVVFNTLGFVLVVTLFGLLGGFAAATVLKLPTMPRALLQGLMIFAWALPPVVVGSLWKFLFSGNGIINALLGRSDDPILFIADRRFALWSIAAVTVWVVIPFAAATLKAAMLDIPIELYEAAAIDGASRRQVTRFITLPALEPTLLVLGVLTIVYGFRSFDLIYVMTSGGPGTASTTVPFLGYQRAFTQYRYGQGAALAAMSMACVLILAAFYIVAARREERVR